MSLFVSPTDYKLKRPVALALNPVTPRQDAGESGIEPTPNAVELAATRVAKFVPSIILLGYTGLANLVNSKDPIKDADQRYPAFKLIFCFCLAATPLFIYYFDRKNVPPLRKLNIAVGTVAFPVWAYAFPCGWFVEMHKYDPVWAGCGLLAFSMITALLKPPQLE